MVYRKNLREASPVGSLRLPVGPPPARAICAARAGPRAFNHQAGGRSALHPADTQAIDAVIGHQRISNPVPSA